MVWNIYYTKSYYFFIIYLKNPGFWFANSQLWNCHFNSMADQIWIFHIHITKMTSKSEYEKKFGRVCAILLWRENHIDSLTPLLWRMLKLRSGLYVIMYVQYAQGIYEMNILFYNCRLRTYITPLYQWACMRVYRTSNTWLTSLRPNLITS